VAASILFVGPLAVLSFSLLSYEGVTPSVYLALTISTIVEILSEPAFNVIVAHNRLDVKAMVEGVGVFAKAVLVLIGVVWFNLGAEVFAIGQLGFSVVHLFGYYAFVATAKLPGLRAPEANTYLSMGSLMPLSLEGLKDETTQWVDAESKGVAFALSAQNIFKWILTEGDKAVLLLAKQKGGGLRDETESMDAVYGVVFNLGSLLARLVFEPVETQSRVQFDKLASFRISHDLDPSNAEKRGTYEDKWRQVLSSFSFRLRVLTVISGIIMSLGPWYSWLLLHLLYKNKYSETDAPLVLSWYCVYVFFMSLNGMIEALRDAVATRAQLESRSVLGLTGFMVVTFIISSSLAYRLVPVYGSLGIVWSNCLNLILRIAFSTHFIVYRGVCPPGIDRVNLYMGALKSAVPSRIVIASLLLSAIISGSTQPEIPRDAQISAHLKHVSIGAVCGVGIITAVLHQDRDLRDELASATRVLPLPRVIKRLLTRLLATAARNKRED